MKKLLCTLALMAVAFGVSAQVSYLEMLATLERYNLVPQHHAPQASQDS